MRVSHVSEMFRDAQDYIFQRSESLERNRRLDAAKKNVRGWLTENGTPDDDGNLVFTFPKEIQSADSKLYAGVMLRKTVGPAYFDEDEVYEFLEKNTALRARVFKTVQVLDPDELYIMQQEGTITEEELRGLLHYPKPTYALWPVESATALEEEE